MRKLRRFLVEICAVYDGNDGGDIDIKSIMQCGDDNDKLEFNRPKQVSGLVQVCIVIPAPLGLKSKNCNRIIVIIVYIENHHCHQLNLNLWVKSKS